MDSSLPIVIVILVIIIAMVMLVLAIIGKAFGQSKGVHVTHDEEKEVIKEGRMS